MVRVKILGAGSVGNHHAHAARQMGWDVLVCDQRRDALERMRKEIYPSRYGAWDPRIELTSVDEANSREADLVVIGTPPEHHLSLAMDSMRQQPRVVLIEKPLCPPSLVGAQEVYETWRNSSIGVFVGYDHVLGKATKLVEELLRKGEIGEIRTIDVEFREHWQGIFTAHPWLSGPEDTYLGYWERGGGAGGEHSHATNLWQHFAHVSGAGKVQELSAMITYESVGRARFDSLFFMELRAENGVSGRVAQDVVSIPSRKRAIIVGSEGAIEWVYGHSPTGDAVLVHNKSGSRTFSISKTRADDFVEEMKTLDQVLKGESDAKQIRLDRGLDTMMVLAAAHQSELDRCRVQLSYDRYTLDSIKSLNGTKHGLDG